MGSSERVLSLVRKCATVDYPHIIVETYSPPYKPKFSDEDNKAIFIMKKKLDICFIYKCITTVNCSLRIISLK